MTTEYTLIETTPSAEDFCRLRKIAGLSARPLAAAEIGLPRSCYGVHILWQGTPVGMGRIVGDVPELYAKFGFESVRPESEGMARIWK